MDPTAQNQTSQTPSAPSADAGGKPKFILLLILFFCLVIGVAVGLFGSRFLKSNQPTKAVNQIAEEQLPIAVSLLKNPLIKQWRGGLEGTLVAKSENSMVIRDDKGNSLTIPLRVSEGVEAMTYFYDTTAVEATASGKGAPFVKINQILLESYLRGDFFVVPGTGSSQIVGGSFVVVKKP